MRVFQIDEVIKQEEYINIYKHLHTTPEPLHSHKFLEIAYIYTGCGYQHINGKQLFVKHGDLMFFNLNDKHSFTPDGSLGIFNCLVDPKFLSEKFTNNENALDILSLTSFAAFKMDNIDTLIHFKPNKYYEIELLFELMEKEFNKKETGYKEILHNFLFVLLTKIFREQEKNMQPNIKSEIVKIAPEILQYISDHYNQKISLAELAQMSFYSPSYFSKIFKECYNKTLTEFITELRITKALQLLKETEMSIESISEIVGYSDKKNFYQMFRKITGTTPNKFRNK